MLYRKFPRAPMDLSILGFGCMRLPVFENRQVDEPRATEMIRYAIDHGVNYVDTAYPYHDGQSEPVVGRALSGGYREKVWLATKLPSWLIAKKEDMDRYLDEQLERLATDHIDFYLVHGLNQDSWENTARLGVLEFLDEAVADGRIRYPAFSFHDSVPIFKEIVDAYDWTFAQIQYNFMDEQYQAGTEGLLYAAERGVGIVVMEPLRGGLLAKDAPGIREIFAAARPGAPRQSGASAGSGTIPKSPSSSPVCRPWSRSERTSHTHRRGCPDRSPVRTSRSSEKSGTSLPRG